MSSITEGCFGSPLIDLGCTKISLHQTPAACLTGEAVHVPKYFTRNLIREIQNRCPSHQKYHGLIIAFGLLNKYINTFCAGWGEGGR